MSSLDELSQFLQPNSKIQLKLVTIDTILGLTGSKEGLNEILKNKALLQCLIDLLNDKMPKVGKDCGLCLVNISGDEKGAEILLEMKDALQNIYKHLTDPQSIFADQCVMILSNLTRCSHLHEKVLDGLLELEGNKVLDKLIQIFSKSDYNKNAKFHYLGPVFSNLSQGARFRNFLLDKEKCILQRLIPYTEYKDSLIRRGGIVGMIKNCCFEEEFHEWLLSEDIDLLPRLLLPLAGNEQFDDEDNEKLPLDLQYLPDDKQREEDPDIRCMLLESLIQLCSRKKNREFIRDKNTYVILRELHKWEKDRKTLLACENLVDILIRTEEEIARDNIKEVEVPEDLVEKFHKMDEEFVNDT